MAKTNLIEQLRNDVWACGTDLTAKMGTFVRAFEAARKGFAELLTQTGGEQEIHRFLEEHPVLLVNVCMQGCFTHLPERCALYSHVSFGSEYEADFAFVNGSSLGAWWVFVELERADDRLFTKAGDPSKELSHALRQLTDWQTWLGDNQAYAESSFAKLQLQAQLHGHGNFRRDPRYVVIMGRRGTLTSDTNRRRVQICNATKGLEILTYDRLVDPFNDNPTPELFEEARKDEFDVAREEGES